MLLSKLYIGRLGLATSGALCSHLELTMILLLNRMKLPRMRQPKVLLLSRSYLEVIKQLLPLELDRLITGRSTFR